MIIVNIFGTVHGVSHEREMLKLRLIDLGAALLPPPSRNQYKEDSLGLK